VDRMVVGGHGWTRNCRAAIRLVYPENENPVFAPWTPNGGGGPPCLWEFEGHLYSHRWLEPNVAFLNRVLGVRGVSEIINRAVDCLVGQLVFRVSRETYPKPYFKKREGRP
jgi:hypothetical protein